MANQTPTLPDDLQLCHNLIKELHETVDQLKRRNEQLGHRLGLLLKRMYGRRSEKLNFHPDELLLFDDLLDPPESDSGTSATEAETWWRMTFDPSPWAGVTGFLPAQIEAVKRPPCCSALFHRPSETTAMCSII